MKMSSACFHMKMSSACSFIFMQIKVALRLALKPRHKGTRKWPIGSERSAIWSEIIRVILKSNEREARVSFEITSMISDQNCTTRSSITTSLDPF